MKSSNQIQIQQNQKISTVTSLSAKDDLKLHERKGFDPEELIQQMALGSSDSRSDGNWDIQDIHTGHPINHTKIYYDILWYTKVICL